MAARNTEIQSARVFNSNQVLFPDISYNAFTYPGDQEALAALKKIPGAGPILTYLQANFTEQLIFVENNEQMIRAGTGSFESLQKLVVRCAEILSLPVPELYVTTQPSLNAYTVGHRRTCIVLHSALIEAMTADELSFIVGHELGHIKCGHGLYRQLGDLLLLYWDAVSSLIPVPGIGLLRIPLLLAYWEWYRRAEHTCDRAGLLCVQDREPAQRALAKLAGKVSGFEEEFKIESAMEQHEAHKDVNKLVQVVAILKHADRTHPFVPARLKRIHEYAESAEYAKILSGDYERDMLGLHEGGMRIDCICGAKVNSKLNFCPECGQPVQEVAALPPAMLLCAACGRMVTPETKFCPDCGAKQEPAQQETALSKLKSQAAGFLKRG